jgi:DNA excision repair protein ERCC-5
MAPADGRVVALDYGCGAHSEVQVDEVLAEGIVADGVLADEILADDLLREGEGDEQDVPGGEPVTESDALTAEDSLRDARVLDARVLDALALDDDLVEDAIEDLDGTVPVDAVEGLILDDAGEQDDPSAEDEPTDSSAPVAAAAPKRPRGRGWLRGRSS